MIYFYCNLQIRNGGCINEDIITSGSEGYTSGLYYPGNRWSGALETGLNSVKKEFGSDI